MPQSFSLLWFCDVVRWLIFAVLIECFSRYETTMDNKLDYMPLMLAVAIGVIIPVMSRLNSVQVISYKASRNVQNGPPLCALNVANETSSSSEQDCSLKCARDATCTGYNIKNSITCDHINTPVLALTSRTHSPVITSIHLYWLQHQELTYLWSHQYTCTRFNIKNSITCDHINTPVLASTSRTHSPVMCTIIYRRS